MTSSETTFNDAELIARLRDFKKVTVWDVRDAADRIEQLVATNEALGEVCTEWAEVSQSNYQRAKAAEAKLAKAVEGLNNIDSLDPESLVSGCSRDALSGLVNLMGAKARTTLAEISSHNKGESHE